MLKILSDNTIQLTRGDTAYIKVPITVEQTGQPYTMAAGDVLKFTAKKKLTDATPCFQKVSTGTNQFHIYPADTCNCEFASYIYDVQLTLENGDVFTVVPPATLKICSEVTE